MFILLLWGATVKTWRGYLILHPPIIFWRGNGPPSSDAHAPNPHVVGGFSRTPSTGGMHPNGGSATASLLLNNKFFM